MGLFVSYNFVGRYSNGDITQGFANVRIYGDDCAEPKCEEEFEALNQKLRDYCCQDEGLASASVVILNYRLI